MKPIIGITTDVDRMGNLELPKAYSEAIIRTGGIPLILPTGIEDDVEQILSMLDGIVFSGGGDINPLLFNEEPHASLGEVTPSRDIVELKIASRALELDKPILGICRGAQILSIVAGGTIYQDIHNQYGKTVLQHSQIAPKEHCSHTVHVEQNSLLHSIVGSDTIQVNSYHHQSINQMPTGFRRSGVASDGIIEAIEGVGKKFVLGVQWHPEQLAMVGDSNSLKIFQRLIEMSSS
jgi:putative glutamine amidotransferase